VKGIRIERFVCDLLFIGIESGIQREGVWAEGNGIMSCDICDRESDV
jgi:hypothetical protein